MDVNKARHCDSEADTETEGFETEAKAKAKARRCIAGANVTRDL